MPKPTKKKILANVWKPLIMRLNKRVDEACLQRDAYLDRVFRHEAEMLAKEMTQPNSTEARKYIAAQLDLLDRKQVNFALSPETVETMNTVCADKKVPRDAFINRVLLFLVAGRPAFFEGLLGFPPDESWREILRKAHESFEYPLSLFPEHLEGGLTVLKHLSSEDPFWAIRACIDHNYKAAKKVGLDNENGCCFLHQAPMNKGFLGPKVKTALGFNCHLPNNMVEGHPTQIQEQEEWDDLFE